MNRRPETDAPVSRHAEAPKTPASKEKIELSAKEARLAAALRENLRRRKNAKATDGR